MRAGIVGCGVISRAYAKRLGEFDFVEVTHCADLERDRAETLAKEFGIPVVAEPEELCVDADVDLIVNLTIPRAHFEVSMAGLRAGKHVYSEKPLAFDRDAVRALCDEAASRGRRLGCAPDTFLGAGLQTCRKLIDDGAIGEPVAANLSLLGMGPESWHPRPQLFYERGAGPMFDMGPYYVAALVFLLGPVRRVAGIARITHAERTVGSEPLRGTKIPVEVPTHVAGVLEMVDGPIATLTTSFDVPATRIPKIEIYGTEGTIGVPDPNTFGGPVRLAKPGSREWEEVPFTHGHQTQSRGIGTGDMVWAERTGRAHRCSGELAAHTVDVMQSILESSESGAHLEVATGGARPAPLPTGLADTEFDD